MYCRCANLVAQYKALGGGERGAFKRTIVRMYTPAFRRLSLLKSIYLLQQLSSPMLLRLLMQAIADPDSGARSFIFACLMGAGAIIGAVAEQHHEMTALEVGARARVSRSLPLSLHLSSPPSRSARPTQIPPAGGAGHPQPVHWTGVPQGGGAERGGPHGGRGRHGRAIAGGIRRAEGAAVPPHRHAAVGGAASGEKPSRPTFFAHHR